MNTALYDRLLEEIRQIPVIDAHEHLQEESWRISQPVDVFTLFSHYTHNDLVTAGMSREDCDRTQDPEVPLDERWALFEPWWERARHTSYCRAALIAAKRFCDADDITVDNYVEISERIQEHNTPGLYDRVLKEACGIKCCLTQCGRLVEENQDILRPVLPLRRWADVSRAEQVAELAAELNMQVSTLDDYCDLIRAGLAELKAKGVVGFKIHAGRLEEADRAAASGLFDRMISDDLQPDTTALGTFLIHETIEACGEIDLPVAVHCGIAWTNWNDFTVDHPRHMIPVILAHRNTRFDLYHAGIPWIRETGIIGKSYPNVWLNLCWVHIISQKMAIAAMDEWLDLVPYNKILGFGGDYRESVEKVYGHLEMAREDITKVLAARVEDGYFDEDEALSIARAWLFDNPNELYKLGLA